MLPNYFITTLKQSLASGGSDTEIFVNSITTVDGQTIAITDFAAENNTGYLIVDPQSSANVEYISFTGIDGSGIGFTGATRGLSFKGDGTVIAANKIFHAAGANVIIGWSSNDLNSFVNKYTAQTINGTITFAPLSATPLVATGTKSGNQIISFTDASNIFTGSVGTATSLTFGTVKLTGSSATVVSNDDTRVPTVLQSAGLAGDDTTIAVSAANKYVTQTGLQNGSETYALTAGSSIAFTATLNPAPTAYVKGQRFYAQFHLTSGTTPTINFNGLGAKSIYKSASTGTTSLAVGDISTLTFAELNFDGGAFQLGSPVAALPSAYVGALTTSSGTTSQNLDTVFTSTVTPKLIYIYYRITGGNTAGGATKSIGVAIYNSVGTLLANHYPFSNQSDATNITATMSGLDTSAPTSGTNSSSGTSMTISIPTVSGLNITVRATIAASGSNTVTAIYLPVVIP